MRSVLLILVVLGTASAAGAQVFQPGTVSETTSEQVGPVVWPRFLGTAGVGVGGLALGVEAGLRRGRIFAAWQRTFTVRGPQISGSSFYLHFDPEHDVATALVVGRSLRRTPSRVDVGVGIGSVRQVRRGEKRPPFPPDVPDSGYDPGYTERVRHRPGILAHLRVSPSPRSPFSLVGQGYVSQGSVWGGAGLTFGIH